MKVSVVGTGYVGLVTGVCLAVQGHEVFCVDRDADRIADINAGILPMFEPSLGELLKQVVGLSLRGTIVLADAISATDLTLICVGTPSRSGRIDLSQLQTVAKEIGASLKRKDGFHTVVVKSTVVPGTTDGVVRALLEEHSHKKCGHEFGLGVNPEFLTEGSAVHDFMEPDRIVIGASDRQTLSTLKALYTSFADAPIISTGNSSAEMIKYSSNALLATLISFSNEIGRLCSRVDGVDVAEVMTGVHNSHYLMVKCEDGRKAAPIVDFLEAGCGFGGSCLPKDTAALIASAAERQVDMSLLRAVLDINQEQPREILTLIQRHYDSLQNIAITVLGLAFKPDTDDMRESPAIPIIRDFLAEGAIVTAYDPVAMPIAKTILPDIKYAESLSDAVGAAEIIVLVTRWEQFRGISELISERRPAPLLVDGRRMLEKTAFAAYEGIGL